jgi:hypothetical protein
MSELKPCPFCGGEANWNTRPPSAQEGPAPGSEVGGDVKEAFASLPDHWHDAIASYTTHSPDCIAFEGEEIGGCDCAADQFRQSIIVLVAKHLTSPPDSAREGEGCTGVGAQWCPKCGTCTCDRSDVLVRTEDDPECPLHGTDSEHDDFPDSARESEGEAVGEADLRRWRFKDDPDAEWNYFQGPTCPGDYRDDVELEEYYLRPSSDPARGERDWIEVLGEECWDLRCKNIPTGGDDYDVWWEVIQHHMAKPTERVVGEGATPQEALAAALLFAPPTQSDRGDER